MPDTSNKDSISGEAYDPAQEGKHDLQNLHGKLNAESIARIGSHVDQATTEQLRKRIQLLERWKERGLVENGDHHPHKGPVINSPAASTR